MARVVHLNQNIVAADRFPMNELRATLKERGLDGWLIYDFHGVNPVARRVVGYSGMVTRRVYVLIPAVGEPHVVVHGIDAEALSHFEGTRDVYTTWADLQRVLGTLVRGRRLAMEVSPENAVPYLDRVPLGVAQQLERLGATIVPSAALVTRFAARWSTLEREQHRRVAESLARIARATLADVVRRPGAARERDVQQRVTTAMTEAGWVVEDPPVVAFGANSADPHYAPSVRNATLQPDQVVLLDLWARHGADGMWADQTWMGFAGTAPPHEVVAVWEAVRDARDAVVDRLRAAGGEERVTGADLDTVARDHIRRCGYGAFFVHRTGHSIDYDIHGSGPHLDDFETHDVRELLPGVGFSVEPGVYLQGKFGIRSEINVHLAVDGPEVTPAEPQRDLILAE